MALRPSDVLGRSASRDGSLAAWLFAGLVNSGVIVGAALIAFGFLVLAAWLLSGALASGGTTAIGLSLAVASFGLGGLLVKRNWGREREFSWTWRAVAAALLLIVGGNLLFDAFPWWGIDWMVLAVSLVALLGALLMFRPSSRAGSLASFVPAGLLFAIPDYFVVIQVMPLLAGLLGLETSE